MALISDLIVNLKADVSRFHKSIDDAGIDLMQFGKNAGKVGAGIALAIGTTAVAGFTTLLHVINETEEKISRLVDTAGKFDTSVAGLQKLEYIAKLSGGSLDDVQAGMSKIVMSLKELDAGAAPATAAFEKLGLSQEKLKGLKIDEVYLLVAERLKGISDSTEQAKIASEIFGKSWSSQINIVKSDIQGLSTEFEKFGGALTEEQAAAVDSYGDSVTKLGEVFNTFKLQLTAQVAPALEMLVNWISEATLKFGGLGPVANTVAQYFVSGIQIMVSSVQFLIDAVNEVMLKFNELSLLILKTARIGTLGLSSLIGEKILDVNVGDIEKRIDELKKRQETPITGELQKGLSNVQGTLQQQSKQQVEVKISTEQGLRAEIALSPEIQARIDEIMGVVTERAN